MATLNPSDSAVPAPDVRALVENAWSVVARALPTMPRVVVSTIPVSPDSPHVRGRLLFPSATELDTASPFRQALDGSLEGFDRLSERGDDSEGRDPLRTFYFLLMPPLRDVLQRGFDLPFPLHAYQADGVGFLAKRKHALLADDMGLGKTIQTIVAVRTLLGSGFVKRALIVCPAGLKSNWKAEFRLWAPEVLVQVIQGDGNTRQAQWNAPSHVFIANYELLRNDSEYLPTCPFDLVVLDEAQRIKNAETATSRAIKAIPRRASWCLTGTPIENRPQDLVSIVSFMKPDLILPADASPEEIRSRIAPYFLRRRKADVLKDLPPKQHFTTRLELSDAQRKAYLTAEEEGTVFLRSLGETVTLQHVLALLTRLKQICNFDPATGESAKLDYLLESLDVLRETGEKALVFSQYTETLRFLAERLSDYKPLIYSGELSRTQKDAVIRQFKEEEGTTVLLISLQAGGIGLNLQEASYVFHFDRWWNPAVERQAEDRAYRMGQTRPVLVTRLVTVDTIEERIDEVLSTKQALFNRLIDETGHDGADSPLSDAEYFHLVGLDPALAKVRRTGESGQSAVATS